MQAVEFGTAVHDGKIEIPREYRQDFSSFVRVILIKDEERHVPDNAENTGTDLKTAKKIAAAKRLVGIASKNPMTLDEIRNERLARQ
jgi:hypothetical protein